MISIFTLGDLHRSTGVAVWKWREIFEKGILPEPQRVGGKRVVTVAELPTLEQAMIKRGYLKPNQLSISA